jgi:O-antigen ligase
MVVLLLLFVNVFSKYPIRWSNMSMAWLPYLMLTIGGYFFKMTMEYFTTWSICLMILLIATNFLYLRALPSKLIFWSGMFALLGIFVQMYFPNFYYSRISPLFLNEDNLENWIEGWGYAGFTHQLGSTSSILIYGEVALLYMKDALQKKWIRKKFIYNFLVILIIIGVLLTGKRLISALAMALPFMVYFFSTKLSAKKLFLIFSAIFMACVFFLFFASNLDFFLENQLFHRFARSYLEMEAGGDITSGRTDLYDMAWNTFLKHPAFGVGVGGFKAATGAIMAVHNTYLQVLCEQGVVGFTVYIIPIVYCFFYTLGIYKKNRGTMLEQYMNMSLAFQLIYIIYGLTGNVNTGSGYIMYFIGIAIAICVEKNYKSKIIRV